MEPSIQSMTFPTLSLLAAGIDGADFLESPSGRILLLVCLLGLVLFSLLMILVPLMRRSSSLLLRRITSQVEAMRAGDRTVDLRGVDSPEGEALLRSLSGHLLEIQERSRKLEEERRRWDGLLDASLDAGILATDAEGRITLISRGACALLGYTAGDLAGRSAEVLFPEEAWREILPRLARRSLGETGFSLRSTMMRRDRTRLPVALSVARTPSAPHSFAAVFRSAAAEGELERRVEWAEQRLARAMESIQDPVLILQDGRIQTTNSRVEPFFRRRAEEIRGMPLKEIVSTEEVLPTLERAARVLAGGAPDEFPVRVRQAAGPATPARMRFVRLEAEGGGTLLATLRSESGSDAHPRLVARSALLEATLDSADEGILVQELSGTAPAGILVNASLESLLNAPGREILGWSQDDLLRELEKRGAEADEIASLREAAEGRVQASVVLSLKSPPRSLEVEFAPLKKSPDEPPARVVTFRDVTARRLAELSVQESHAALAASESRLKLSVAELESARAALDRHNTELEKLNRELRSVDEMKSHLLANVSHELQTPLVLIKGYTEMILKRKIGPLTAEQEKGLSVALKNIDRLVEMIDNLLDFSRMERGESPLDLEEFPLWQVVDEVVELMREKIRARGLSLTTHYETDDLTLRADRGKIAQVFINLLSNAVKFNREGGKIEIRVGAGEQPGTLLVEVSDTGIGIPPQEREKIFDRFYQVDASAARRAEGTGIGLSIVRDILALHGCSIRVEGGDGEGSRFRFTLPQGKSPSPPRFPSSRSRSREGDRQRTRS
jgi:PAS domain S-box-containing protein